MHERIDADDGSIARAAGIEKRQAQIGTEIHFSHPCLYRKAYLFVGYAASAVQDDGHARLFANGSDAFDVENGQTLIPSVRRADHCRERFYPRFAHIKRRLVGIGILGRLCVRCLPDVSEFPLHGYADMIAQPYRRPCKFNVFFKRFSGRIEHDSSHTQAQGTHNFTFSGTVIEMKAHGNTCAGSGSTHCGRKIVVTGRSMLTNTRVARELGYLNIDEKDILDAYELNGIPDDQIVVMCTGSQGEPLSALSRMANGEHKTLSIHSGDTVIISATPVPGNEKAVQQVINSLAKLGCTVVDKSTRLVHVSGHGSQEELKLMLAMAKPSYFMPVHGEAVHLRAHANLARQMGMRDDHIFVVDNGDTLEMRGGEVKIGPQVESGIVYVDGLRIGDTDPIVLRDRQKLANDGMVTVVAIVSMKRKRIDAIEFSSRGVSFTIDDEFSSDASASIMKAIDKGSFDYTSNGTGALRKAVRDSLSNFIWNRTRTRPMIIPVVMEV